ncbi:type II secretion system minor pseudopilin GspI [Kordiimonas sp. SCSIO 12603]|uniref:type II secretion system minor pseudopilin GspI n=1 Tax=Kordiimonas sp. SCSIO 12603 TaxID=2829596 RepID=UPI002105F3BA|nr:type II secretion system minor pseudopilin GspI [Kordiimonas sp. SCSIO 12603]UTW58313.1 type II secretion system minor pseudopilin GspI [Kordiimonas sp. SCSIO 12603]
MKAKHLIMAEDGFSLIELLVAVALLSLVAVTLLQSQSGATKNTAILQEKALALMVAENQIARLTGGALIPNIGNRSGEEDQLGVKFQWQENVRLAPGGKLLAMEVSVFREDGVKLAELVGFRRAE